MRPSDIETVSDFIDDELSNRSLAHDPRYEKIARDAQAAFLRIVTEINERQLVELPLEDTFVPLGSVALRIVEGLAGKVRKNDDNADANQPNPAPSCD